MDEKELINRLHAGDEDAFEDVFSKHFGKLCLYAEHYVWEKHVAREIVENFFCDFWENCTKITIESNLSGYMFASIHNRCLKYLRHEKVKQRYIESRQYQFTDSKLLEPLSDEFPEAQLILNELERDIAKAIESLPGQCRKVFMLKRFNNMTYREIADKLGITVNTVKTQMTRAMQKLRSQLREYLSRH